MWLALSPSLGAPLSSIHIRERAGGSRPEDLTASTPGVGGVGIFLLLKDTPSDGEGELPSSCGRLPAVVLVGQRGRCRLLQLPWPQKERAPEPKQRGEYILFSKELRLLWISAWLQACGAV